jgi:hypothetical protein
MGIFDEPSREPLPQPNLEDVAHAGRKVLVSMIPVLGAAGSELVGILSSPLALRRDAWLQDLERRLRDLESKVVGFRFEDLAQNDQFVSATLVATQGALKTHQREKLDAFKNAVLNVALGKDTNADRQGQFLTLVDRFTAAHLTLLRFFQDPAGHFERRRMPIPSVTVGTNLLVYQLVSVALPELRQQFQSPAEDRSASVFQMFQALFDDLTSTKLIALQRVKDNEAWIVPRFTAQPIPYPVNPVTTHLGDDFLAFITEPREEQVQA